MARITIDCDGVLADFNTGFIAEANKIWPGRIPADYVKPGYDEWDGLTRAEIAQVWERIDNTPNWWLTLNALPDEVGELARFLLTQRDQDIHICTARKEGAGMTVAKQTKAWLFACGVAPGSNYLGVIPVVNSHKKASVYKALGVQWSIDDKGETVLQCDKLEGHNAFLLDRLENRNVTPKRRVGSMKEFFDAIKAATPHA